MAYMKYKFCCEDGCDFCEYKKWPMKKIFIENGYEVTIENHTCDKTGDYFTERKSRYIVEYDPEDDYE